MYCRKCGKQLSDTDNFCRICGEPTGILPADSPRTQMHGNRPFQTWFLVSGIITIVFAGIICMLTGCISIIGDAVGYSDSAITAKFSASALSVACGIVSVAARKRTDCKGAAAIIVLGLLSGILSLDQDGRDPVQAGWMIICAVIAVFSVFYIKRTKTI